MKHHDTLLAVLAQCPEGLTLAELQLRLPAIPRRTLQRQIAGLLASGQLVARGAGRARRYFPGAAGVAEPGAVYDAGVIPLSADSRDVLAYVQQPLAARKPVGYQREFLEAYQPNQTWYLPEPLRRQLLRMGRTSFADAPAGTYSRGMLSRLLIDLSWASSHLEGNTYSRLDTQALIEFGKAAQGKAVHETQMILNHKAAIELLLDNAAETGFSRLLMLSLHGVLAWNLLPNPADEGRVRQHAVDITHSVYRPLSTLQLIDEQLNLLLSKAAAISDPFEQAFFVMVQVPYLQPFADVNKRTSRLAANLPLFRANLCPLTFLGVPQDMYVHAMLGVYEMARVELLRDVFVWAYERSVQEYVAIRQSLAEPDPLRLGYRDVIRQVIHDVVTTPEQEPLTLIRQMVAALVPAADQSPLQALLVEELRRLHEGVLARNGLRPSEFLRWKQKWG